MSITTHMSTIRQYVKNHTKDEIALFFEDQFIKKDARIAELEAEVKKLKDVADQAIEFADIRVQWINEDLSDDKTRVVDSPSVGAFSPYLHALADYIEDQEGYERESPKEQTP